MFTQMHTCLFQAKLLEKSGNCEPVFVTQHSLAPLYALRAGSQPIQLEARALSSNSPETIATTHWVALSRELFPAHVQHLLPWKPQKMTQSGHDFLPLNAAMKNLAGFGKVIACDDVCQLRICTACLVTTPRLGDLQKCSARHLDLRVRAPVTWLPRQHAHNRFPRKATASPITLLHATCNSYQREAKSGK